MKTNASMDPRPVENPLDALLETSKGKPEESSKVKRTDWKTQHRADQKYKLGKLRKLLERLELCCLPSPKFKLPPMRSIFEVRDLVSDLSFSLTIDSPRSTPKSKKRRASKWTDFTKVDRRWKLSLCSKIKKLFAGANKNAPRRPMGFLQSLSTSADPKALLAGELLAQARHLQDENRTTTQNWRSFTPLLILYRDFEARKSKRDRANPLLKTRLKGAEGSPDLIAYTVFLEMACEDANWARRYALGMAELWRFGAIYTSFSDQLDQFFLEDGEAAREQLAKIEVERRRKAAAERQSKHRKQDSFAPKRDYSR